MNSQDLRKSVIDKLRSHTEYNSRKVRVEVDGSVVKLLGHVDGEVALASLEGLARSIDGVSDVINLLKIDAASTSGVQGISVR